ncbi:DUF2169 domain-containing protein [Lelliottia aquatilis]|uniref:DUF2169 domain-containing protein n=1 Tax=Lelliottia aquatilis TaxID=2080838 RepID=UPI000DD391F3|nr:DUF2169 domain-containing protein [Lelliottia aquatilis]
MEFRNLTPFSVMEYAMDDKHNESHRVVVMKTLTLPGLHPDGDITFTLPAGRAGILLRMNTGECVPQMMWSDTLHIDTGALTVAQTWRYLVPVGSPVRVMEARYSMAGE